MQSAKVSGLVYLKCKVIVRMNKRTLPHVYSKQLSRKQVPQELQYRKQSWKLFESFCSSQIPHKLFLFFQMNSSWLSSQALPSSTGARSTKEHNFARNNPSLSSERTGLFAGKSCTKNMQTRRSKMRNAICIAWIIKTAQSMATAEDCGTTCHATPLICIAICSVSLMTNQISFPLSQNV